MGIDGTSSQALDDDPAAPAADDNGTSSERSFGQQASPVEDRGYQRAEPLTREEYADSIRADDSPIPQDSGQERADGDGRPYARFSVVGAAEAERTLGDTTPTGIGVKPTGEQLLGMKGDEPFRSRLDRLFDDAFEHADDVSDAAGHISEALESDLRPAPGPAGQPRSYHATTIAARDQPPPQGVGVSDAVGSITVVSVAAVVAVRHALSELRKRA